MIRKNWLSIVVVSILMTAFYPAVAQTPKKLIHSGKDSLKANKYGAAVRLFTEAIGLDQTSHDAYALRGQAYEGMGDLEMAAKDYSKATNLKPKDKKLAFEAARVLYELEKYIEAIPLLNRSIDRDENFLRAQFLKVDCLIALNNLPEAMAICDKVIDMSISSESYFYHGKVSESLGNYRIAEGDYKSSIKLSKSYKASYVGLARVLSLQNKTDEALSYCNKVISDYPDYSEAYLTRSKIYYRKSDLLNAVMDMTTMIAQIPLVDTLYFIRAGYNFELKLYEKSISDYSKAISLNLKNHKAYFYRASVYEVVNKIKEASSDYLSFLELTEGNLEELDLIGKAKKKVFELNKESDKPEILLSSPKPKGLDMIEVALNASTLIIEGVVQDQNKLKYIRINDKDIVFNKSLNMVTIKEEIYIADLDKITFASSDVYDNALTFTYKIVRTEIDPPLVDVLTPYTSDYDEVFLESESSNVFIEGKISDQSLIKSVTIEGVPARFISDQINPNFSATIDITGKEKILVKAVDIFGNTTERELKLNRESARILSENPMGKTWVIFIENSDYESFASLEGPSKDITTMRSAFSKYDIHNVIVKKNMTKLMLEKFFSLELRDLVKNQKVNSLLVWYAGHGKFINETGYWVPTDAKRDEEFTYFNVNSLKAFMQSYTNYVTHVLVVTDACESGPSFYAAMRGAKDRTCDDLSPTKFKSSQVFSSAGYELAADNSPFTKTFAKSLDYNTNSCIAIDNIVKTVTESMGQGAKQAPKFGKIQGLEDEEGTFFFIKKTQGN